MTARGGQKNENGSMQSKIQDNRQELKEIAESDLPVAKYAQILLDVCDE